MEPEDAAGSGSEPFREAWLYSAASDADIEPAAGGVGTPSFAGPRAVASAAGAPAASPGQARTPRRALGSPLLLSDELDSGALTRPVAAGSTPGSFLGYRYVVGERFGECDLVRPLGRGGMGEVWLARNVLLDRDEAVKILTAAAPTERARTRFIREAKASLKLCDVPGVVQVYGISETEGRLSIHMEHVPGESLDRVGQLPPADVMRIFKQMAASLAEGHRRGLVHRDIKPSNYIRARDGSVKLMDFGIARAVGSSELTQTKDQIGTPIYMSREQWEAAREVDARADVYSLGVTFYELLSGHLPYEVEADAPGQAFYARLLTDDPLPLEPPPGTPQQLPNLILKAMAKRAKERFEDAGELLAALEAIERDSSLAIVAPVTEERRRRHRLLLRLVAALLLVAGLAAGAVFGWSRLTARRSLGAAQAALSEARSAERASDDAAARGAFADAVEAADRALRALAQGVAAAARARERGADATEARRLADAAQAERRIWREVRAGLHALDAGEPGAARQAFAQAVRLRGDPEAFSLLRARSDAAVSSAAALARARTASTSLEALREVRAAASGALDPEAVAIERRRIEARARQALAALVAEIEAQAQAGETSLPQAEKALSQLSRYPGGEAERVRLGKRIALLKAAEASRNEAATALAGARAAEARGPAGRADALRGYAWLEGLLAELPPERRAAVAVSVGIDLVAVRAAMQRLKAEERVDLAAAKPEALAGFRALWALRGEMTGDAGLAGVVARIDRLLSGLRSKAAREAADGAWQAAAAGDGRAAYAQALEALRVDPGNGRLRDLARYAGALAVGISAQRVLVPPLVVSIGGRRDVYLAPFFIDRHEVSNRGFRRFVAAGGYARAELWPGLSASVVRGFVQRDGKRPGLGNWLGEAGFSPDRADAPATAVSLHEARAFARFRGGRLPTPDEWTVAAGYDASAGRLRAFPWGDDPGAVRARLSGTVTVAVTDPGLATSPLGGVGFAGNVREWVEADPPGVCGGCAWDRGSVRRTRLGRGPMRWSVGRRDADSVGFRCAYDVPEPPEVAAIRGAAGPADAGDLGAGSR